MYELCMMIAFLAAACFLVLCFTAAPLPCAVLYIGWAVIFDRKNWEI